MRVMEHFADENGNLPEKLSYLPIELIDRLIVMTMNKIDKPVHWDDIAGVEHAKTEVEGSIAQPVHILPRLTPAASPHTLGIEMILQRILFGQCAIRSGSVELEYQAEECFCLDHRGPARP